MKTGLHIVTGSIFGLAAEHFEVYSRNSEDDFPVLLVTLKSTALLCQARIGLLSRFERKPGTILYAVLHSRPPGDGLEGYPCIQDGNTLAKISKSETIRDIKK